MADLTTTAVTDGTPATAAVLNGNTDELNTINGGLEAANLKSDAEITKPKIRRGSSSRHVVASALVNQKMTVGAVNTGADLITDEPVLLAGQATSIELPPGAWSVVVSFKNSERYDRLAHRVDGGAWIDMDWTAYPNFGSFLILYPSSTQHRIVDVVVKYTAGQSLTDTTLMDVGESDLLGIPGYYWGHHISVSIFRSG